MKHIGFVCTTPLDKRYPPASRIISLASLLQTEGFLCTVFCTTLSTRSQHPDFPFKVEYSSTGTLIKAGGVINVLLNARNAVRLSKNLLKNPTFKDQEFLIVRGDFACLTLSAYAKRNQKTLLLDFHGFLSHEKRAAGHRCIAWIAELISRRTLHRIDGAIEATKFDLEKYRKNIRRFPLRNGIDERLITPSTKDLNLPDKHAKKKIVVASSLSDYYEFDTISKICSALQPKYPECELHIFGGGAKEREVRQLASTHQSIFFHGFVPHDELHQFLYKEAFCGVLPVKPDHPIYNQKGIVYYPRKVLEYFSVGIPVIFPEYSGKSEILEEGLNSISFAPYSVDDGIKVCIKLFEDFALYQNICLGSLQTARKYTWKKLLKRSGLLEFLKA